MTAWLVENAERKTLNVAMPNAHGMPCYLVDEHGAPVLVEPARAMSGGDRKRHLERQLEQFSRVDEVFQGMIRRYG